MDKDNTMTFRKEGDNAFPADKGNENPSDSSPENTNPDQTRAPEGELNSGEKKDGGETDWSKYPPLDQHPRWKERDEDWKKRFNEQEARHVSEIQKLREEFLHPAPKGEGQVEVPDWFGGDEAAWGKYAEHTQQLIDKAVEKALGIIQKKTSEEQKAIDDATKYFQDEVAAIEADKTLNPQGLKIDRNKILNLALKKKLVDTEGNWNYRAAFEMMNPKDVFEAKQALQDRKNLANATTSDQKPEIKPPTIVTSADFQKPGARPW